MNYHRWSIVLSNGESREGTDNFPSDELKISASQIKLETANGVVVMPIPVGGKAILIRRNRRPIGANGQPIGPDSPTYIVGYELDGIRETKELCAEDKRNGD